MNLNNKCLFDTSAVLALLYLEQGYQQLEPLIASSVISTVNYTEVITVLIRSGISSAEVDLIMQDLVPTILPYTTEIAAYAGKLVTHTKQYGLSLGDRACIATGMTYNIPIYTTDKIWAELNLPQASIKLIR